MCLRRLGVCLLQRALEEGARPEPLRAMHLLRCSLAQPRLRTWPHARVVLDGVLTHTLRLGDRLRWPSG